MKPVYIKCTKTLLVLDENELLQNLSPALLEKGIRQGKYYKRCQRAEQYEKSRTDWEKEDVFGKEEKE